MFKKIFLFVIFILLSISFFYFSPYSKKSPTFIFPFQVSQETIEKIQTLVGTDIPIEKLYKQNEEDDKILDHALTTAIVEKDKKIIEYFLIKLPFGCVRDEQYIQETYPEFYKNIIDDKEYFSYLYNLQANANLRIKNLEQHLLKKLDYLIIDNNIEEFKQYLSIIKINPEPFLDQDELKFGYEYLPYQQETFLMKILFQPEILTAFENLGLKEESIALAQTNHLREAIKQGNLEIITQHTIFSKISLNSFDTNGLPIFFSEKTNTNMINSLIPLGLYTNNWEIIQETNNFFTAVKRNDLDTVKKMIKINHFKADTKDFLRNTPLHFAVSNNINPELIKFLIKKKAQWTNNNVHNYSPLNIIFDQARWDNKKFIQIISLDKKFPETYTADIDGTQNYIWEFLIRINDGLALKHWIDTGINIHQTNEYGLTPILLAASTYQDSALRTLLNHEIALKTLDKHTIEYLIETALNTGGYECIVSDEYRFHQGAIKYMILHEMNTQLLELFPEYSNILHPPLPQYNPDMPNTIDSISSRTRQKFILRKEDFEPYQYILFEKEISTNTPIYSALNFDHKKQYLPYYEKARIYLINFLLAHGADINYIHPDTGNSFLMYTVVSSSFPLFDRLIRAGADVNHTNYQGENLLHILTKEYKMESTSNMIIPELSSFIPILAGYNFNFNAVDHSGYTAYEYIRRSPITDKEKHNIFRLLKKYGADPSIGKKFTIYELRVPPDHSNNIQISPL